MDVSLRHWPIFVTGLLLGAAGTLSLGLQHPTERELAAVTPAAARPTTTIAAAAPAATVAQVGQDTSGAERADEQMRAAAEAFRAQEALAASAMPLQVVLAQWPKPRVRRIVKDAAADSIAAAPAPAQAVAIGWAAAPPQSEPAPRPRSATSVMGGAPARRSEPGELVGERVEAARGSSHAPDGEASQQSD